MTYRIATALGVLTLGALGAGAALAQDDEEERPRPAVVETLYSCQQVADPTARLACFDQAVAAVQAEERERNVIITDREQVRKARRGLFGLGDIRLGIFSGSDEEEQREQITEINAGVRSVSRGGDGRLQIALEDGAVWAQTDGARVRLRELQAKTVHIKRSALGAYVAKLDGGTPIRVRRIN